MPSSVCPVSARRLKSLGLLYRFGNDSAAHYRSAVAGLAASQSIGQRAPPNPAIERTCPGKPGHASHLHVRRLEMLVRQGERRDAENLAALAIQVWLHTYATGGISSVISRYVLSEFTPEKFEALLSEESSTVLVAEKGKNLMGYAKVSAATVCPVVTSSKVELATLYVQAPFVGKGVGHALLRQAEAWAKQRKNTSIWLTVNSKNFHAISFYAKHGYTKLGLTHFELGNEKHENLVLGGRDA